MIKNTHKGFEPNQKTQEKKRYSLWISNAVNDYLENLAKHTGVSTATLLTNIITKYVDREILTGRLHMFIPYENSLVPLIRHLLELDNEDLDHNLITSAANILKCSPNDIYKKI